MKYIELRRHGHKAGIGNAELSQKGIQAARTLGSIIGDFDSVFVSPLSRTGATVNALAEGGASLPEPKIFPPHTQVSELPEAMALWTGVCHQAERSEEDMLQAALLEKSIVTNNIATLATKAFREFSDALPKNSRTLVIGHSPFLEIIALGVTGKQLKGLDPLEGFSITVDGDTYILGDRLTNV